MAARDLVEATVKGWDRVEKDAGGEPVIDFDCAPSVVGDDVQGRFDVLDRLGRVRAEGDCDVESMVDAHSSYLRALLGERFDLDTYVRQTQGCPVAGWTTQHLDDVFDVAHQALDDVGVPWGSTTRSGLLELSPDVPVDDAGDVIRGYADKHLDTVRKLTGARADFHLEVETVALDA